MSKADAYSWIEMRNSYSWWGAVIGGMTGFIIGLELSEVVKGGLMSELGVAVPVGAIGGIIIGLSIGKHFDILDENKMMQQRLKKRLKEKIAAAQLRKKRG